VYIFIYKYVARACIYFECGWRIPKEYGYGKKSAGDGDGGAGGGGAAKRTYVLCEVQVKCEVWSEVVLLGLIIIIILWWKLWISEGTMDQGAIDRHDIQEQKRQDKGNVINLL